jgi:phosphate transport system substrate-binding protein
LYDFTLSRRYFPAQTELPRALEKYAVKARPGRDVVALMEPLLVTRESYLDVVLAEIDQHYASDADKAKGACLSLRTDGRVVEIDGDYTETLARLDAEKNGVGIFGMSFYENNTDKLRVGKFQGVTPTAELIASGKYSVSRPLFMYVKAQHIGVIPGLKEFVEFFVSDEVAGPGGPLEAYGLVPDPKLSGTQAAVAAGKTM